MPADRTLGTVLILGSGPIVIGQACEFDYSGTQACRALRRDGYRVVLVNSNPATIMTDPGVADRTYLEPITPAAVEAILVREQVDAVLPTLGGQTALNTAVALAESGALERHGVRLIGADLEAIRRAEDRDLFRETMARAGIPMPRSGFARSVAEAEALAGTVGYPVVLRPSFTLGGAGGGRAETPEALRGIVAEELRLSPSASVLVEEDLTGWKEIELEVMRDAKDNAVIVCGIENLDPMGVHTGDSITVAPIQTLTDRELQRLRDIALETLRAVGVATGGSNVQFAVNPDDGRIVVIEMNPRVSRSSALASKATGFPIAKIAARLAVGFTLDEIANDITRVTPACFEPSLDYVVVKIPRWTFEKFPHAEDTLGTRMKSVGEVMAIGRTFAEAFLKALASLEIDGLTERTVGHAPRHEGSDRTGGGAPPPGEDAVMDLVDLARPTWERPFQLLDALREGSAPEDLAAATGIDRWFLDRLGDVAAIEAEVAATLPDHLEAFRREEAAALLRRAKRAGLGDAHLAALIGRDEAAVRDLRRRLAVMPVFKAVDTCAAEFPAETPYFYSTYESEDEGEPLAGESVVVLGSGPNRIGQGIEFDYCCVAAAQEFRRRGRPVILINSNPETVSTDYDVSDRLYFEPLTREHVTNVLEKERPSGAVVQFGGQTPLKLAETMQEAGVPILGTSPAAIEEAENRERFRNLVVRLDLSQPRSLIAVEAGEVVRLASALGFPVLVRPSHVLGGRGMAIVQNNNELELLLKQGVEVSKESPVLLDAFLEDAVELDVDAVSDGTRVRVGAVLEHLEEAGVHSGDSCCMTPPYSVGADTVARIRDITANLARSLEVVGLLNVQFAVKGETIYILEANPRASRTVPFVCKATGLPLVHLAVGAMLGDAVEENDAEASARTGLICVKKPVLPFDRFPGEDTLLGPEMKSTGGVMGWGADFGEAFAKAETAAGTRLPDEGTVFLSVRDADKRAVVFLARRLRSLGFGLAATGGTARFLKLNGMDVEPVYKIGEGRPTAIDRIAEGKVQLVLNSPTGTRSQTDGREIRLAALSRGVPCVTTLAGMIAMVSGIEAHREGPPTVRALQDMLAGEAGTLPNGAPRSAVDASDSAGKPGGSTPARGAAVEETATAAPAARMRP